MNFAKHYAHKNKGSFVWKRNSSSSNNNRRPSTHYNNPKVRLNSQSSEYSNFQENQTTINSLNIHSSSKAKKSKHQNEQWNEIKSLAKRSTIASRLELKKSIPTTLTTTTDKTFVKNPRSISMNINKPVAPIIDKQGNLSKSFKRNQQFESINPHIQKDVNKLKKKIKKIYQKQQKQMNTFLTLDQFDTVDNNMSESENNNKNESGKQRTKSLYMDFNNDYINKISQRPEYSSRKNSNKKISSNGYQTIITDGNSMKFKQNQNHRQKDPYGQSFKKNKQNKVGIIKPQKTSYIQYTQNKSIKSNSQFVRSISIKSSSLSQTQNSQNKLLKGLLGQYENYQKLSKHELIKKLISLEYLAQNIFKKNKVLEQQIREKNKPQNSKQDHQISNSIYDGNINIPISHIKKNQQESNTRIKLNDDLNNKQQQRKQKKQQIKSDIFIIDNDDGYFNQFLESQKGNNKQIIMEEREQFKEITVQQPERFRQESP